MNHETEQAGVKYAVSVLDASYNVLIDFRFSSLEEAVEFIKMCFANGYHRVGLEQE